ncbi:MAG: plasmid stabilization protein, partial [Flavobacteriales bacterium]
EENLNNISHLKKLAGHKSAYRVRIGAYRVGFFYENNKAIFARVIHRKDIYKVFP